MRSFVLFFQLMLMFGTLSACENITRPAPKPAPAQVTEALRPCGYLHLSGTVGGSVVIMDLQYDMRTEEGATIITYKGSYSYERYQEPIQLYGSVDSTGMVVLEEENGQEEVRYSFVGTLTNGTYQGNWTNSKTGQQLPFKLTEDYSRSLAFDCLLMQDSVRALADQPNGPKAVYTAGLLMPGSGVAPAQQEFLKKEFHRGVFGDSIGALYPDDKKAFTVMKTAYFDQYRSDVKEQMQYMKDEGFMFTLNYEESNDIEILWNRDNLLSVAYFNASYSGGAHGNYGSSCYSFDMKTLKAITLRDVLKPGYEKALEAALAKSLRKKFGIPAREPLNSVLFENAITFSDNFYLTGKGLVFNYVPYEIAAYAYGEIRLFVPYSDLSAFVREGFGR